MDASSATHASGQLLSPVGLVATAVGPQQVILAWTARGQGEEGFRVERAAGMGAGLHFESIGETSARIVAFSDGAVRPGATYSYRVRAFNGEGASPPSGLAEITTPGEKSPRSMPVMEG